MRFVWLSIPLLFTGCGDKGLGLDLLDDTGASQGESPVRILKIDPYYGPTEGGTAVTLTVEGLEDGTQVWFGNAELDITKVASDQLLISSPYLGFESVVDVKIANSLGVDSWTAGYTYTDGAEPEPPDTGGSETGDTEDTDTASNTNPTGKTAGLVEMSLLQVACPECFGMTTSVQVFATVGFHNAVSKSWTDWMPAVGSCAQNLTPTGLSVNFEDVGEYVYLSSGSRSISLRKNNGDGGATYQSSGLTETDYVRTAAYDLSVPDDAGKEALGAIRTPQGWETIEPFELLYTELSSAFSANIRIQNAQFSWSPSGGNGTFVILLQAYNPSGSQYLGSVLCRGNDNGAMTIPSTQLQGFPKGALLAISLYRYQIENATLPGSGHSIEGIASFGVMGTGVLR
jgi:hypothetical protein